MNYKEDRLPVVEIIAPNGANLPSLAKAISPGGREGHGVERKG